MFLTPKTKKVCFEKKKKNNTLPTCFINHSRANVICMHILSWVGYGFVGGGSGMGNFEV